MNKALVFNAFRFIAVLGNILIVLWVFYNAMDSGWQGTIYEKISGIGLFFLLGLNSILLLSARVRDRAE